MQMRFLDPYFYSKITGKEVSMYERAKKLETNSRKCLNADFFERYASIYYGYSDIFYEKLCDTVKKNELSSRPVIPLIISLVFTVTIILPSIPLMLSDIKTFLTGLIPTAYLVYAVYAISKENSKIKRILECVTQRQNVFAFTLDIDGAHMYKDYDDDSPTYYYYIRSGQFLVRVTKKLYDKASPDRRLVCVIIGSENEKIFYAVDIE